MIPEDDVDDWMDGLEGGVRNAHQWTAVQRIAKGFQKGKVDSALTSTGKLRFSLKRSQSGTGYHSTPPGHDTMHPAATTPAQTIRPKTATERPLSFGNHSILSHAPHEFSCDRSGGTAP